MAPPRTNLPAPVNTFVGRGAARAHLVERLATTRLLTLVGAGGVGKTRLALEVAADALDRFPGGAWLVELAPVADARLIAQAVASALRIEAGRHSRPPLDVLVDALRDRHLLLVLDNCEHLVDACADLTHALLAACPRLSVLATSREALRSDGESVWRVPPLSYPEVSALPPLASLRHCESVALFVDRATAAEPAFRLTEDNAPSIVEICRRLDGIPLAIELAAGRVRALSVAQIAARLDDRFRLLTGGSRTALPRHQTLRAALDWSHALLSGPEQAIFRRLAVFAGGWRLDAARPSSVAAATRS